MSLLPKRFAKGAKGEAQRQSFANELMRLQEQIGFKVSSRGWCYILEEKMGLLKGDFNRAQDVINDCRKNGMLPYDFTARDETRKTVGEEKIDDRNVDDYSDYIIHSVIEGWLDYYKPISFWDNQEYYIEMVGEKIDLRTLFETVCKQWDVPYTNLKGWSDINSRGDLMNRLKEKESEGKQCVLLYCGDHDPGGIDISNKLRKNLEDLAEAQGIYWYPDGLIIERFGLNYDFIEENNLSWIFNLETSSGKRLDNTNHPDSNKSYVVNYIGAYGVRKVEANALVVRPDAGRAMCREAILKYIDLDAATEYREKTDELREELREKFLEDALDEFGG